MARSRAVNQKILTSEHNVILEDFHRVLFMGLILYANDFGKLRGHPDLLKSQIWPYDSRKSREDVEKGLRVLQEERMIYCFEADGSHWIKIINWDKYQRPDHPGKDLIPKPLEKDIELFLRSSRKSRECVAPVVVVEVEGVVEGVVEVKELPSPKNSDVPSASPKQKPVKNKKTIAPPSYWPEVIAHMKKTWERKKPDAVFEFGGKEAKLLQSKVRAYMAWGIMALWDKFLDSDDKWYRNTGYSISTFVSSSGIGRLVDDYSWKKDAVKYEEKLNGPMVNLSLEGVVKGLRPIDCSDLRCTEKLAYCAPCQRRKNSMVESPGLAQVPANKYS